MKRGCSRSYFEAIGADWDRLRQSFFSEKVRRRALAVAAVGSGSLAADLGAGTGFLTEGLLERGARVVAVDQSPSMLAALARKFPWPDRVDCRTGDAARLPIDDAAVDHAFANMYLHHVEDPALAVREMRRILRPGGRLVVTDLDSHQHEFLREEHHDRWLGFERDHIRRWFVDAGLENIQVSDLGESCCASSAQGERARVSIFLAHGMATCPP